MPGPPWLVLPTYNEAENLETVVTRGPRRAGRGRAGRLPDPRRGRRLARRDRGDRRPPRGRPSGRGRGAAPDRARRASGPRTSPGFGRALDGGAGFVLEMDADLSHDPADLARLLAAARARRRPRARLALRRRAAGSPTGGRVRRAISRGGSWYARRVLGVGVRDLTGGFKCFRAEALAALDLATVRSHGYAFQVELTYRALCAGVEVVEVPIVFRDRLRGESKMSWRIALEAILARPRDPPQRARRDPRSAADRLKLRPPRAEAMSDEPSRSRPRPGPRHTRATLRRWNGAPWRVVGLWALGSLAVSAALLYLVWAISHRVTPDTRDLLLPGINEPVGLTAVGAGARPQLARPRPPRLRLHRGFIAGSELPLQADRHRGLWRRVHAHAGPLAIAFVGRRDAVLPRHPGLRPRQRRRRPWPRSSASARRR